MICQTHYTNFLFDRLEILENQLSTYGKSMTEDKLREETKRLMEDKEAYQLAAKDNLKKLGRRPRGRTLQLSIDFWTAIWYIYRIGDLYRDCLRMLNIQLDF